MSFRRIVRKILPDGTVSVVQPFHVCTEGKENRIVCKDEEDLRVAHNFIPICARRNNVLILMDCELNTHMHSAILASSYADAYKYGESYKKSYSKYYHNKYGVTGIYSRTDSRPIPIEDDRHLRNTICYIPRNSLDVGVAVNKYKWSSYRALFSGGTELASYREIKTVMYREKRELFKTSDDFSDCNWLVDRDGLIVPESYCDTEYVESCFYNDARFFLKVLGITDDKQMEQILVNDHIEPKSIKEIIHIAEEKSLAGYGVGLEKLSVNQKIPIVRHLYYSIKTTPAQIARCIGLEKSKVLWILGKDKGK